MKYLPSTKIVVFILAVFIAGGAFFFANNRDALLKSIVFDRGINNANGIVVVSNGGVSQSPAQTEGNWQDTLNKIVPNGGEVGNKSESMTDKLAREIIAKAPELQSQDGGIPSDQSTRDVVDSVIKDLPAGDVAVVHAPQELSVINDSTAPALKTYGDSLLSIFKLYSRNFEGVGYEITIVEKTVNTGDESDLARLPAIESLYKNMIHDLIALKVPKDAERAHLNLVNAYEVIVSSTRDMESVISDPARGLVGISRYKAVSQIIQNNIMNLNSLFTARGVVF